ncbi:hypothetical protein DFH08DRAFT_963867 [Mycena albidolilacea]|uniref:Uncharacterized protein n=1 Tax=Mycena albidolilacea TaxID=1033008 RepID=A0AAD6ZU99_9AGAR|nr:hypothetical protein DFH08DRAFT_963867 [Mycena albidolilacea]
MLTLSRFGLTAWAHSRRPSRRLSSAPDADVVSRARTHQPAPSLVTEKNGYRPSSQATALLLDTPALTLVLHLVHITVDCRPRHTRCTTQDQTLRARNVRTSAGLPRMYERVGRMYSRSFPPLSFSILRYHSFLFSLSPRAVPYRPSLPTYRPIASLNQRSRALRLAWCAARADSRVALLCEPGSAGKMSSARCTRSAQSSRNLRAHTSLPHPAFFLHPSPLSSRYPPPNVSDCFRLKPGPAIAP